MMQFPSHVPLALILWPIILVGGCSLSQAPPARQQAALPVEQTWHAGGDTDPRLVDDGWLSSFQDSRLPQLIEEALQNNRDLQGSAAKVAEAEARARKAGASLLPTLDLSTGAGRSARIESPTGLQNNFNLGLEVSWEVDLWGRLRSEKQAQALDAIAEATNFEFARLSLAALVAESWFVTVGNKVQLALEEDILELERNIQDVVQKRVSAGAVLQADLNLAKADTARAQENVARSQGSLAESVRSLEVLLGRYPSAELEIADQLKPIPVGVPAGLPSELLERRPDIVARDRQVAAAFNRTKAARAARLPRLALTGSIGGTSESLPNILNPANVAWSIGSNLLAPIFDGGRRRADIDISTAQQEQALAAYASTALKAFQEVETALVNEQVLKAREARLTTAADELAEAVRLTQLRYNVGEIDLLSLNQVKKEYFSARRNLLQVQIERLKQRINLHLALGGSFEDRPQT